MLVFSILAGFQLIPIPTLRRVTLRPIRVALLILLFASSRYPAAIMAIEFPQEIVDEIVDHLADDKATRAASLHDCSLVSSQWLHRSQKHLFHKMWFTGASFSKWCEEIRPGDGGPSAHVIVLHYHANFTEAGRLAKHHIHLSSFTNLQKLHLRATQIHGSTDEELSSCFKQMGLTVRSVSLRACEITINDLVSFIRHFVKLERLSLIDPIVYNSVLDDSVESPVLSGVLELRYMFVRRDIWDFIYQLSLLPLTFHTVVLEGIHISLLAPVNELLATCHETLTRIDIRDRASKKYVGALLVLTCNRNTSDFVRNINLADCNVLREMHLNMEIVNHLPSIIKTVTSPQLEEIRFILSDPSLERHCDYLEEWELIDEEICALVDRIRPARYDSWRLSLRFVITSTIDTGAVGKSGAQLLPASNKHKYITISTDRTGLP